MPSRASWAASREGSTPSFRVSTRLSPRRDHDNPWLDDSVLTRGALFLADLGYALSRGPASVLDPPVESDGHCPVHWKTKSSPTVGLFA